MERVNLIAVTSLKYKGQRLNPGDTFTAARAHARAFKAIGKAKDHDGVVLETKAEASSAQTYHTKDLEAETPSVESGSLAEPRQRRNYKRRDMTSKG